jgi:hypothetical protein
LHNRCVRAKTVRFKCHGTTLRAWDIGLECMGNPERSATTVPMSAT